MTTQELAIQEQKLNELIELVERGVKLPMSPEAIVRMEAEGHLVDLDTGELIEGGARWRVNVTEQGRQIVALID